MRSVTSLWLCVWFPAIALGQAGRGAWTMFGGDPQRSGWNRNETDLTKENVGKLKLEWSAKLDARPKALTGLTAPLGRVNVATPRGVKDLIVVAGAADQIFVIDGDTGKIFWEKTLAIEGTPERGESWLCPNGLTATPAMGPAPRSASAPGGGRGGGGQAVLVLASDGKLHSFNLVSGEEVVAPIPFTPPFAKVWSLNVANNVVYTATSQGCNGVKSAVFAMDLNDPAHKITTYQVGVMQSGVWGRAGVAVASDGRIVAVTGDGAYDPEKNLLSDSVLTLAGKELKLLDYYTPPNRAWLTKKDLDMGGASPAVFPFKSWELAAAAGKEGVIHLLDMKSLGGADHHSPLFRSLLYTNEEVNFAAHGFWGGFSTWADAAGTRWLYAPAWGPPTANAKFPVHYGETPNGSVMAFKVEVANDKPALVPAWNSVDMSVPTPVIIANGMVFALSDGDNAVQFGQGGGLLNAEERRAKAGHAVLYALDAVSGKVLFSSGDTMRGFSHFAAPAVLGGRVYVTTYDGTVYAFGLGQN